MGETETVGVGPTVVKLETRAVARLTPSALKADVLNPMVYRVLLARLEVGVKVIVLLSTDQLIVPGTEGVRLKALWVAV